MAPLLPASNSLAQAPIPSLLPLAASSSSLSSPPGSRRPTRFWGGCGWRMQPPPGEATGCGDGGKVKIPHTIVDPEWCGIVAGGPMCCHNVAVHRAVVFQGINTGRRFYGCGNEEGDNCGLVQWIDPEWPEPMKNALRRLWDMYEQSSKDNESKEKIILKLAEEKRLIQEKHHNHIKETSNFFATIHKNVMKENYQKIMEDGDVESVVVEAQEEMARLQKENVELKTALQVIKQSNDELISNWKKAIAEQGMEQLKKEKKRLEYIIADLLKAGEENKSKIRKITEICNE